MASSSSSSGGVVVENSNDGAVGNSTGKRRWQCPSARCGSFNYETTNQGVYCADCGMVLEESSFDLSVSFTDNQDGSRSMNGQFVSNMCTTPYRFHGSGVGSFTRESREVTIQNGKKKIQQLAAALKLNSFVDAAHRLFLSAVQRNFVHGRKTTNVVAACLYIVCRQRNAPHLLIDFSDVLQTNVYVLGNCFLKFRRLLNLDLPAVDPVHYIDRFAAKLEFGDKTHDVAKTAHKLVARMKRDWIQTGRRPSGVCGAALIIAARLHGHKRTQREVVNVMKICEETLRKRLVEFEKTPSGNLTVEEFLQIDLPEEADPPSFTRNRKIELKKGGLLVEKDTSTDHSQDQLEDDASTTADSNVKVSKRILDTEQRAKAMEDMYKELEMDLEVSLKSFEEQNLEDNALLTDDNTKTSKKVVFDDDELEEGDENDKDNFSDDGEDNNENENNKEDETDNNPETTSHDQVEQEQEQEIEEELEQEEATTAIVVTNKPIQTPYSEDSEVANIAVTEEDDDELFQGDVDAIVLKPEESRLKKVLWQVQNKEYLEKERQEQLTGKSKRKRKRKTRAEREAEQANTAEEATQKMVESSRTKHSKKINLDGWNKLFELDG